MKTLKLEEIKIEREALRKRAKLLDEREREIHMHQRDADLITADSLLIEDDEDERKVNFIMGYSGGFIRGFNAALIEIIEALSNEYRHIKMTEDELHMLIQLGEKRERAWLKDDNQARILKKNGWEMKSDIGGQICSQYWQKKGKESEDEGA